MIMTIEVAVGYMLKVLKTNQKLTEFKDEFSPDGCVRLSNQETI